MGFFNTLFRTGRVVKSPKSRSLLAGAQLSRPSSGSGYLGAVQDRLTDDFKGADLSADASAAGSLVKLRARARQLYMSNPYASRYISMVVSQTLGMDGIKLEAQSKQDNGDLDDIDNKTLERAWRNWSRPAECSVTGKQSLIDVQRLCLSTMARDGEVLIRLHKRPKSKYGLALQVLECDSLLTGYNASLKNGGQIRMGVECDKYGKPIAYHLATRNPSDGSSGYVASGSIETERVPAEEVIHLFIQDRPDQTRGITWLAQSMRSLHMTEAYRESELVNARVSANKMAFYTSEDGDGYTGDDIDDEGNLIYEAEAGMIEQLPKGVNIQTLDWSSPKGEVGSFVKSCLRGVASGLNVSYNGLSNDLEGVNFSSIRAGVQDEREVWKYIQSFLSEHLMDPIYNYWLECAVLVEGLKLPPRKLDKFREVVWRPRGFSYVDPVKDNQAYEKAVSLGVMSRTEIASQQGKDFKDVLEALAREEQEAYAVGVNISPRQTMPIYPAMPDPEHQAKGEFNDPEGLVE